MTIFFQTDESQLWSLDVSVPATVPLNLIPKVNSKAVRIFNFWLLKIILIV